MLFTKNLLLRISNKAKNARFMSTVIYNENGHPFSVLKVVPDNKLPSKLRHNEVAIRFLAAPINPADLNMVRGGYGIAPKLPAIGGSEGVAVVTDVGSAVKKFQVDDRVVPNKEAFGTWRNFAATEENNLLKVSSKIPVEYAATISVNPCTAYRMLNDFVDLKEGDVLVQNGGDGNVAQCVTQLAALRGVKTVNIIRNSNEYETSVEHLKALGAHIVCPEDYASTPEFKRLLSDLPPPKLGLNCIGGQSAKNVVRALGKGATFVTYGGMSFEPVIIPTSALIFKNITAKGFWMTKWVAEHTAEEREQLINEIATLMEQEKFRSFVTSYKFKDFHDAVVAVQNQTTKRKVVLKMED